MSADADFSEVTTLFRRMTNFISEIPLAFEIYNEQSTQRLLQLVISHASGRPGPRVVTGNYISNFRIVDGRVVNASPQTHRLEYGFVGTDSLGRAYNQPPFPHFRPALEEMHSEYVRGIVPLIRRTWNSTQA